MEALISDDIVPPALPPLRRPSSARYAALIDYLARAKMAEKSGKDRLQISLRSLVEVIQFLDADPEVQLRGLTRPLSTIVGAIMDFQQGGKPDILFNSRPNKRGAPTNTSFDMVRGTVAAALSTLIAGGESRAEAAQYVVTELQDLRVKGPNGRPISGRLALQWRDEIGGRASDVTQRTYDDLMTKYDAIIPVERQKGLSMRRGQVRGSLMNIPGRGF